MGVFESQGVPLYFIDAAPRQFDRGEPILLIHGFASNLVVNWDATLWIKTLTEAGRRVIAFDNRGHGRSGKLYRPEDYRTALMAQDAVNLLDHLGIERADVMGYSMGARITAVLAHEHQARTRSAILGGLGYHLVDGGGLPQSIDEALEAPSIENITDTTGRLFRRFAEANKSDLAALAACIRGSRQNFTPEALGEIACPLLVAVGTNDAIAGNPHRLAELVPGGQAIDIVGRDHNLAVGDKTFKAAVLSFLECRI